MIARGAPRWKKLMKGYDSYVEDSFRFIGRY